MRVLVEDADGQVVLEVVSDGEARFKVAGNSLRDNVGEYETDDDLHVAGLIQSQIGARFSMEYLRRRLNERIPESSGKEDE